MEIMIPEARISFEVLGKARPYQDKPNERPRWSATFLIPQGSDLAKHIDAKILEVATAKWQTKTAKLLELCQADPKGCCWVKGDRKEYDGYQGMMALTAHRYEDKGRPLVMDNDTTPIYKADGTLYEGKGGRIYSGCYVRGKIDIYVQDNGHGKGIRAELKVVQRLKAGDAFGGGTPPTAEGFDAIEDGANADDLT